MTSRRHFLAAVTAGGALDFLHRNRAILGILFAVKEKG